MNNAHHRHKYSHLNQFFDMKDTTLTIKNPQSYKLKNMNNDAIKILTNKLPSDFFRPYTRGIQTIDVFKPDYLESAEGMRTPCFGQQRKQSYSMSLIPKEKKNVTKYAERIETLPITSKQFQEIETSYIHKRNLTQRQESCEKRAQEFKNQFSYRQQKNHSQHAERCSVKKQITHRSVERHKIKFHNKLINEQVLLQPHNIQKDETRVRLNIRKFFKQGSLENKQKHKGHKTKNIKNLYLNKLPPLIKDNF